MRNKATKKNMDLDLRRYGNKLYSKAEKSGGSGGGSDGGSGGGEEPWDVSDFYLKFRVEDFGGNNPIAYTPDYQKEYDLDEIFDMSDDSLERHIEIGEKSVDSAISDGYSFGDIENIVGAIYYSNSQFSSDNSKHYYLSFESGDEWGYNDGMVPEIYIAHVKYDGSFSKCTSIVVQATNLKGYSASRMRVIFEKNAVSGKWLMTDYGDV